MVAPGPPGGFGRCPVSLSLVTDPNAHPAPAPTAGPHRPTGAINQGPIEYKGEPLDSERGPGLGCFRFQLVVLVALIVATPLSVGRVPDLVTAGLLFATILLLLVSGQTIIFLLRLVAADRRGRRAPLDARTPTVGQLEDAAAPDAATPATRDVTRDADVNQDADRAPDPDAAPDADPPPAGPVRQ